MKKSFAIFGMAALLCCSAPLPASAFTIKDLTDLFSGDNGKNVSNFLEGVFATSDITVADMAGQWTVDGSAVSFQTENFLKKAGGAAATAAIEAKLDPYYKQYGLTGAVYTIQSDGTFTLAMDRMTLNGNITKQKDGNFLFTFTALGSMKIGEMTTYVRKTPNKMDIMFDASKLKGLMQIASKFTGSKLASTAVSLLESYDGICVGFSTTKTGDVKENTPTDSKTQQQNSSAGKLLELLRRGGKK